MFKGLFPAVVTPFKDGKFDEKGYRKLLKYLLDGGVDGIVPNGTTGENPTLTDAERESIIRIAVEMCKGYGAKVIAGAGTNNTARSAVLIQEAAIWGADGALVITPYYNKPTQDGLLLHFRTLAKNSPIPIVMYNVPSRTNLHMTAETSIELSFEKNIVCLKEASSDLVHFAKIMAKAHKDFTVLSGEDGLTLPMLSIGCSGVVSVAGNVAPRLMKSMLNAWNVGNLENAKSLHFRLLPLFETMFLETSPSPCKAALEMMGICSREVRLPLSPVRESTIKKLRGVLTGLFGDSLSGIVG